MKKKVEHEKRINFFNDILLLNKHLHQRSLMEAQIIFYIATFVFSFLLTKVVSTEFRSYALFMQLGLVVMVISAFLSLFRVIFILRPGFFEQVIRKKERRTFNPFFFRTYKNAKDEEDFVKKVHKIYDNDEALIRSYSDEVYEMGKILEKHYNIINRAADILITGVSISLVLVIISLLFHV